MSDGHSGLKIETIDWYRYKVDRKEPFVIATGASKETTIILVHIRSERFEGWGAASPNTVTGETTETIERFLIEGRRRLVGVDPSDLPRIHRFMNAPASNDTTAMAGVDIAVHDLIGKIYDAPVVRLLGQQKASMETSMTIGISDLKSTISKSKTSVKSGFGILKLKIGLNLEEDIHRIREVRKVVGDEVRLRIDCNQGYSVKMAERLVDELEPLSIEFIEQPVPAYDWEGLRDLTRMSSIPIMADEMVKTLEDAERLAEGRYADMLNVKLMKCGGIYPAMKIADVCDEAGIKIMIGCMAECQASIAAGLHFALSREVVEYVDLDSHLSLSNDPTLAVDCVEGVLFPRKGPGLGLEVNQVALLFPFPYA
jgi:L-alanine-DL-glutamate epimerase-like enolase superfamily enzyme